MTHTIEQLATLDTLAADAARAAHDFAEATGVDRIAPALRMAWYTLRAWLVGEPLGEFWARVEWRIQWSAVRAWTWGVGVV